MAAGVIVVPSLFPARDRNNRLVAGALLEVFNDLTTTRAAIFSNSGLTTPLPNPVTANSSGVFPLIWAEAGTEATPTLYTISISGPGGVSIANPSIFSGWRPSVDADVANAAIALAAAASAEADAEAAAEALAEILEIAADAPEAPSIANKANLNGGNLTDTDRTPFRLAINAAPINTPQAYGVVDPTGVINSTAALVANVADRTQRMVRFPDGILSITAPIIDSNLTDNFFPPRSAKDVLGGGAVRTIIKANIAGDYAYKKFGASEWYSGGIQERSVLGQFSIDGLSHLGDRKGLRVERLINAEIRDMSLYNLTLAATFIDCVGLTFRHQDISFTIDGAEYRPGPGLDLPGNPGSPCNIMLFEKPKWVANLDRVQHHFKGGNITILNGSTELFGAIELSGEEQDPEAVCHIWRHMGNNAGSAMMFIDHHVETCRGKAIHRIEQGSRPVTFSIEGGDFIQNGIEMVPGTTQEVDHFLILDLTDQPSGGVAPVRVMFRNWSALWVNGATTATPLISVINPNGRIEGLDYFIIDGGGNYLQNAATAPRWTNNKYYQKSCTLDSFGGVPTTYTAVTRVRKDGDTAHIWAEVVITTNGAASGAIYMIGTGVEPLEDTPLNGFNDSGQVIRGVLLAGTQNMLITKGDGAYAGGDGVTLTISGSCELEPGG